MLPKDQTLNQGRYRVINQIGQDETGAVYECFDETAKVKVLLKEILFSSKKVIPAGELEKLRETFISKARKLLELNHDSLLKVSDYFAEIERFYLVIEYAEGNNLNKLLEKDKCSFAFSNVMNWADQLLFALNYLHTHPKPLFHNSIKPQNLRLTVEGKLKVFPVGISAAADNKTGNAPSNQSVDAEAISYLPLEQIWDRLDPASQTVISKSYDEKSEKVLRLPTDARSDIYSFGATLYHLASGQAPIDALTRSIDLLEGKPDPLPPLCELNSSVPREVSEVLMKSLEIKRENRFDSAVIMRQVLRTALLRAKERQASEPKKQISVQKAVTADADALPQKFLPTEQNLTNVGVSEAHTLAQEVKPEAVLISNPPAEIVSLAEIELMKERLRKAEEDRLKAEQRAAEAERLLMAQKNLPSEEPGNNSTDSGEDLNVEILHDPVEIIEDEIPEILSAEIISENDIDEPQPRSFSEVRSLEKVSEKPTESVSNDFDNLFAQPEKENKIMVKAAAAGLVLALIGGAVWGVLNFSGTAPAEIKPSVSPIEAAQTTIAQPPSQPVSSEKPDEKIPAAVPTVETEKETTAEIQPQPDTTPELNKTSDQSAVKQPNTAKPANKPKTTATPVTDKEKKPAVASAKTPEPKKKAVTMDDLLN